jgi:hypothetical protein
MKKQIWRAWLSIAAVLGLAAGTPAHAELVTFDDVVPPTPYGDGESFVSGGFLFTQVGMFGVVDGPAGFSAFGNAPTNAVDQFYAGLNDSGVTMTTGNDRALMIQGFDFSFVPFVTGYYPENYIPGALLAYYETFSGALGMEYWFFSGADANGAFAFSSVGSGDLGGLGQALRSVTFVACVWDEGGVCINPADNLAQFAIDNIYASVPEPGSLGLALVGLALMGGVARRRRAN